MALFLFFARAFAGCFSTLDDLESEAAADGLIMARPLRVVIPSAWTGVGGDVAGVLYAL